MYILQFPNYLKYYGDMITYLVNAIYTATQRTEVRFAWFFSGWFITAIAVNPRERKLAKYTSVQRGRSQDFSAYPAPVPND